ncbi:transglycosylase domain-containing protein [Dactylosporangium sp. CS-047395]|uniref:transglycosylase domain-containing protein n=1 Tax=Dactylosporangium sp. CS-047395 TaxID=3239936 RepID=UPI003D8D9BF7
MNRKRLLAGAAVIVVLLGGAAAAAGIYAGNVTVPELPDPGGSTEILYSDGTLMARTGQDDQVPIDTGRLPGYVADAVIAAQDPGFRDSHWFGRPTGISIQYTRRLEPGADRARLAVIASRLESRHGKDVILDRYLNTVYFGRYAYGIEAASQAFYDKPAATLSPGEAVVLAAQLDAPGTADYDPTLHADAAKRRFEEIRGRMTGGLTGVVFPEGTTRPVADTEKRRAALRPTGPAGLIRTRVLAEFDALHLPAAGARITTTIDAKLQSSLLGAVGTAMTGQPGTMQAAAVAVQPGTGRIVAYYGGENGAGLDYAGLQHPPGNTFAPVTVAAALKAGISLQSKWQAPAEGDFPAMGRTIKNGNPIRDTRKCPGGKPSCTLLDAQRDGLKVPLFAVIAKTGPASILDMARSLGVGTMWIMLKDGGPKAIALDQPGDRLYPQYFDAEAGLGQYPVPLLDQANTMATLAADGRRAKPHLIAQVTFGSRTTYRATDQVEAGVDESIARNVAWALTQQPAGKLADGRQTALAVGDWPYGKELTKTANAAAAGFAPQIAVAVWVGNKAEERPLVDRSGAPVTGTGLPAAIYRQFVGAALGTARTTIDQPPLLGDPKAGNA